MQRRPLLLISAPTQPGVQDRVDADLHPKADYLELERVLGGRILDHRAVTTSPSGRIRWLARKLGPDLALAVEGWRRRDETSLYFTASESVGLPLAALLATERRPVPHVMVVHRATPAKKRLFFKLPGLARRIHRYIAYATPQVDLLRDLGVEEGRIRLMPFHADTGFFRPGVAWPQADYVASAGLEWRDYPTLLAACEGLPVQFRIAAASPWSRGPNETRGAELPSNVHVASYDYARLRALYRGARFVVVPLKETDFQAGVTTILEAMACGKAVIVTRTRGQCDVVTHGVDGLYVPPGDPAALRAAIMGLLEDPSRAAALGYRARRTVTERMSTDLYARHVAELAAEAQQEAAGCEVPAALPETVAATTGWSRS